MTVIENNEEVYRAALEQNLFSAKAVSIIKAIK